MSLEGLLNTCILTHRLSDICDAAYEAITYEDCVNPDLIAPITLDSYEVGFKDGIIAASLVIGSVCLLTYIFKKKKLSRNLV